MESPRDRFEEFEASMEKTRKLCIEDIDKLWIEYDRHNDILYINFGREEADESIMVEDDVIVRLKEGKLVGIVVSNFSKKVGLDVV
ncbi:MAG: DUF2283 domain-containing protein [Desulfurococcales archaeon]|nr:DUF2283 domain-containing protein [Desulfurococcales archaeon]